MVQRWLVPLVAVLVAVAPSWAAARYMPTWDSLDERPLPAWFDEAKVGIFVHWGVFSVPSFTSEWFWWYWQGWGEPRNPKPAKYMAENYPPGFTYPDFAKDFTCEFFDPDEWARILQESGARYVVLTAKHHEGFTLWPSNVSFNWNAKDVGPKRDLVGDLANAIRSKTNLVFGVYHSLFEWFNPLFLEDKKNNFTTSYFSEGKTLVELRELVERYRPEIVWSDGDPAPAEYWKSREFLAWLYNDSPVKDTVVTNDRWCQGCQCKHGGYFTCDDRYNPGVLQPHKWENCMTLDRQSWGYRRDAALTDIFSIQELITTLVESISCGGNILINVGPTRDGRLELIYQERLQQLGRWLGVNGEAVYGSTAWTCQNDTAAPHVWYTQGRDQAVYVFVLRWPPQGLLILGSLRLDRDSRVVLLGAEGEPVSVLAQTASLLILQLPPLTVDRLPTPWAWALRVTGPASGHCPEQTRGRPKTMSYFLHEKRERPVWSP
ncbi:alpha-L-fucosidase-like [Amblyomma americanum]